MNPRPAKRAQRGRDLWFLNWRNPVLHREFGTAGRALQEGLTYSIPRPPTQLWTPIQYANDLFRGSELGGLGNVATRWLYAFFANTYNLPVELMRYILHYMEYAPTDIMNVRGRRGTRFNPARLLSANPIRRPPPIQLPTQTLTQANYGLAFGPQVTIANPQGIPYGRSWAALRRAYSERMFGPPAPWDQSSFGTAFPGPGGMDGEWDSGMRYLTGPNRMTRPAHTGHWPENTEHEFDSDDSYMGE